MNLSHLHLLYLLVYVNLCFLHILCFVYQGSLLFSYPFLPSIEDSGFYSNFPLPLFNHYIFILLAEELPVSC